MIDKRQPILYRDGGRCPTIYNGRIPKREKSSITSRDKLSHLPKGMRTQTKGNTDRQREGVRKRKVRTMVQGRRNRVKTHGTIFTSSKWCG